LGRRDGAVPQHIQATRLDPRIESRAAGVSIARFEIENGKIVIVTSKSESGEQETELDNWVKHHAS
jgi:hypothetical protein